MSVAVRSGVTDVDRSTDRRWLNEAMLRLDQESLGCEETAMHRFPLPAAWGVELYIKDESRHPTGSLKHRLARSLILYGLCNGLIHETTTLIDASSGSTAVSEAYFAKLLGLSFIAVVPRSTSLEKIALIESMGAHCQLVTDSADIHESARQLAEQSGGHFLDQFTYAERATDWRGNNNIAESIFEQLSKEPHPVPRWIVVGAGTGGTSATIGRYVRYRRHDTGVAVVDPEGSAFFEGWSGTTDVVAVGSEIEGIGRPRVEPSFIPGVVDRMMRITNSESVAGVRLLSERTGLSAGPSSGTALVGALRLACEMVAAGQPGSVVSLLCDRGDRYADTYNDDDWLGQRGWRWQPELDRLRRVLDS